MSRRKTRSKSYYERREELRQALYRIEGALNRYKEKSEIAEIGTIAIELRGLLCGEALFIDLAKEKGFEMKVYTFPPPYDTLDYMPSEMKKGMTHSFAGDSVSLKCEKPWTNAVNVDEWLDYPVVEVEGIKMTPRRLINETASDLGPAHYSLNISKAMAEMKTISLGGIPSYFRTLFKFSEVILELGKRFMSTY